jgi:putative methylase
MQEIRSKSGLAIVLSKLKDFKEPNIELEQYSTPSEIAAEILWTALFKGEVRDKTVLDAACGPGYLGIGALLLGAEKVYFVDISKESLDILKENILFVDEELGSNIKKKCIIVNSDITNFNENVDVVIQNPPFGIKKKHADKAFLEKAFDVGKIIYSFHKTESKNFAETIAKDHGFKLTESWNYDFPLKQTAKFHTRKLHRIKASCFRFEKP